MCLGSAAVTATASARAAAGDAAVAGEDQQVKYISEYLCDAQEDMPNIFRPARAGSFCTFL